jgi:hypothetical protein
MKTIICYQNESLQMHFGEHHPKMASSASPFDGSGPFIAAQTETYDAQMA